MAFRDNITHMQISAFTAKIDIATFAGGNLYLSQYSCKQLDLLWSPDNRVRFH